MVGTYEVRLADRTVGEVRVEREGLYYRFSCRCSPGTKEVHRLLLVSGNKETDLGLCVPMDGGFGTEKKLPVKQCGSGTPEFFLRPKGGERKGKFIPLSPEEPFRYIHRLENAYLERRGEQLGIVIQHRGKPV